MELVSTDIPVLRDWLVPDVPSHWPPFMHSISRVWPQSEPLIPENIPEESCLKRTLNGRILPTMLYNIARRWTVNSQSEIDTPPPSLLGMTSSGSLPHIPHDCKYSKALPTFPWLREPVFCCRLARPKLRLGRFRDLTCNVAKSKNPRILLKHHV